MELKLFNGDYVPDGCGGLRRLQGQDELLARVLFRLTAKRGAFPFLPELGSELYRLTRFKRTERLPAARQYASEALRGENVQVREAELTEDGDVLCLHLTLTRQGEDLDVTLPLKEETT